MSQEFTPILVNARTYPVSPGTLGNYLKMRMPDDRRHTSSSALAMSEELVIRRTGERRSDRSVARDSYPVSEVVPDA
jgi:hypothetical protein